MNILVCPKKVSKEMQTKEYEYNNLGEKDIYDQYFFIAVQRIIQSKQKELDI
jgi:hypothetical protein